MNIKMKQSDVF